MLLDLNPIAFKLGPFSVPLVRHICSPFLPSWFLLSLKNGEKEGP